MKTYRVIRSGRRTTALEVRPNGELVVRAPYNLPEESIECFVAAHQRWIMRAMARQAAHAAAHPEPTQRERAALMEKARQYLPERVAFYSEQMGLWPATIKITDAKTRFGSCSAKGGICFSWRLMSYPPEAIDYVVVHELAHLKIGNHGKAFYALVAQHMPDYRERLALLKK